MKNKSSAVPIIILFAGLMIIIFAVWQVWVSKLDFSSIFTGKEDSVSTQESLPTDFFRVIADEKGEFLVFSQDGFDLVYMAPTGNLKRIDLHTLDYKVISPEPIYNVTDVNWNQDRGFFIIERIPNIMQHAMLETLHEPNGRVEAIDDESWGSAYNSDFSILSYLHIENDETGLWLASQDGRKPSFAADLTDMVAPDYVHWSPNGTRLLVQGAVGVKIFSYVYGVAIEGDRIDWAVEASWSPDGYLLSYRKKGTESDTLWVANLDGADQKQVFEGVFSEVNWLPDGRLVFFTPGKEGGAACWALDPRTGNKELLADSSIVIYKPIDHIAVSPKGDMLAFQAQDGNIWLLTLD